MRKLKGSPLEMVRCPQRRSMIARMEMLPGNLYNFHPGSHTGQGTETGITQIADALNQVVTPDTGTMILLETMAGKGSEIGSTFEELREIIDRVNLNEKIGICFDTCHTWDAGYDLVNDLDGVLQHFDDVIGLPRLRAKLGQGCLGMEAMKRIAQHPMLQDLPFILETPNEDEGYIKEISIVRNWFL